MAAPLSASPTAAPPPLPPSRAAAAFARLSNPAIQQALLRTGIVLASVVPPSELAAWPSSADTAALLTHMMVLSGLSAHRRLEQQEQHSPGAAARLAACVQQHLGADDASPQHTPVDTEHVAFASRAGQTRRQLSTSTDSDDAVTVDGAGEVMPAAQSVQQQQQQQHVPASMASGEGKRAAGGSAAPAALLFPDVAAHCDGHGLLSGVQTAVAAISNSVAMHVVAVILPLLSSEQAAGVNTDAPSPSPRELTRFALTTITVALQKLSRDIVAYASARGMDVAAAGRVAQSTTQLTPMVMRSVLQHVQGALDAAAGGVGAVHAVQVRAAAYFRGMIAESRPVFHKRAHTNPSGAVQAPPSHPHADGSSGHDDLLAEPEPPCKRANSNAQ